MGVLQEKWFYQLSWQCKLATARKEIRKLTFRALALRWSESRNCGLCVLYRKILLRYWLVPGNVKNNRINYLNEKRSLIP